MSTQRTALVEIPLDLDLYELDRVARSNVGAQLRAFLEDAASAVRKARQQPIVVERVSQREWRLDGEPVRLSPGFVPAIVWALSEPDLTIYLNEKGGKRKAYQRHYKAMQAAQDAIARECGTNLGRLASRIRLRSNGDGVFLRYSPLPRDPEVEGPDDEADSIAARTPTPPMPRKSRAKPYDPWLNC